MDTAANTDPFDPQAAPDSDAATALENVADEDVFLDLTEQLPEDEIRRQVSEAEAMDYTSISSGTGSVFSLSKSAVGTILAVKAEDGYTDKMGKPESFWLCEYRGPHATKRGYMRVRWLDRFRCHSYKGEDVFEYKVLNTYADLEVSTVVCYDVFMTSKRFLAPFFRKTIEQSVARGLRYEPEDIADRLDDPLLDENLPETSNHESDSDTSEDKDQSLAPRARAASKRSNDPDPGPPRDTPPPPPAKVQKTKPATRPAHKSATPLVPVRRSERVRVKSEET